jgi:hypothetical protein
MSNVIKLNNRKCEDHVVAPGVEIGIDGFQSLFQSWRSMISSFDQLRDYVDKLRPVVDALPDGPEKLSADLMMKQIESQIREGRGQSIGAVAAVTRALVILTMKPIG